MEDYSRAIDLDPRHVVAYRNRGKAYLARGRLEEAGRDFEAAERLQPLSEDPGAGPKDKASFLHQRGLAYVGRDFARAEGLFSEALEFDPEHQDAHAARGLVRNHLGDPQGALQDLSLFIDRNPGHAPAWGWRAQTWNALGDFDAASRDASRAISLDPSLVQPYNERAVACFNREDYEGCVRDCTEAIGRESGLPMTHLNRGNALLELGRFAEAADDFEAALRIGLPEEWERVARWGLEVARERAG
jgi:tetratricopeptide (TPR) repeat protein